jgi:calmodulin
VHGAQAFRFFDRDGNGSISVAEFESVMTELGDDRLTQDECSLFIKLIDKDGDQEVRIQPSCATTGPPAKAGL